MPGGEHGGRHSDALAQPRDLLPTILDALGVDTDLVLPFTAPRRTTELSPQDVVTDRQRVSLHGESLLPIIRGDQAHLRDFAYTGHHAQQWAVRTPASTTLINVNPHAGRLGTPYELYMRGDDPTEQHDRAEELPDVVEQSELALLRGLRRLT